MSIRNWNDAMRWRSRLPQDAEPAQPKQSHHDRKWTCDICGATGTGALAALAHSGRRTRVLHTLSFENDAS